jgi:HK97 family phage prohead protease
MPWHIEKRKGKFCVIKETDNSTEKCHDTEAKAKAHLSALYANEASGGNPMTVEYASVQREFAQAQMQGRTLIGYASVFDYPIEAGHSSHPQTHFVKPGAFNRTLEKHPTPQVLLNHGQDPVVGQKPLGVPEVIRVDSHGLYVEVPLDKTSYNEDILVSLRSGALSAMSIMFKTEQDSYNDDRTERYIEQVRLFEFGPVTFPANQAAVASLHSLTDFAPTQAEEPSDEGQSALLEVRFSWKTRIESNEQTLAELAEQEERLKHVRT